MKTEINHFLDTYDRSPKTIIAYRNSLAQFVKVVGEDAELNSETYIKFLISLKDRSPSTQRVYRTAVLNFYAFCKAGNWAELKEATQQYAQRSGKHIVTFNRKALEQVITYCESLRGDLFALRDRAFVLTLVDTGLRISEACMLKRGDIDWQECRAILIGKGDKQDVIRFSDRSIQAMKEYHVACASIEPNTRIPLKSLPVFARHDIRASKKIKPISASGMWTAIKGDPMQGIKGRIEEAGVDRDLVRINDFRHYFVTTVYLANGDLKLSQELARHASISSTNRYTHFDGETDVAYNEIFNKKQK